MIGQVCFNNINHAVFCGHKKGLRPVHTSEKDCFIQSGIVKEVQNDKNEFIKNSRLLSLYDLESKKQNEFGGKSYYLNDYRKESINILEHFDLAGLKILEQKCVEIEEKCKEYNIPDDRFPDVLKTMADLYYLNPDTYNYAINSKFITDRFFARGFSSYNCLKCINPNALKEIEKGETNKITDSFISDSDNFYNDSENVKLLHEYLSLNKTEGDIILKRAERHSGIFQGITLNKDLADKIKTANKINKKKTKKEPFWGYEKSYHPIASTSYTIYTYIDRKKELSFADAMLMMPYLDDKTKQEVLENIKGVKLSDNRFKSTSFSESFVDAWVNEDNTRTKIINTICLKAGAEGRYLYKKGGENTVGDNFQHEFLINNNPTETVIEDAVYDKKTNTFILKSTMKML